MPDYSKLYRPPPGYIPKKYELRDILSPPERLIFAAALYRQFTLPELETMLADVEHSHNKIRRPVPTGKNRRDRGTLPPKDKTLRRVRIALGLGPRSGYVMVEDELRARIADLSSAAIHSSTSTPRNPIDAVLRSVAVLQDYVRADPSLLDRYAMIQLLLSESPVFGRLRAMLNDEAATSAGLVQQAADWRPPVKPGYKPLKKPRRVPPARTEPHVEDLSADSRPHPRTIDDFHNQ